MIEVDDQSTNFFFFFTNRHRPIVLQIKPINIQARLQATCDAASCGEQIGIPPAQRITLWCPPLPANSLKKELPQPSSLRRVTLRSIGCLHMTSLLWDSGSCRPQAQVYKPLFPAFFSQFLDFSNNNNNNKLIIIIIIILFPLWTPHFCTRWKLLVFTRFGRFEHS